MAKEKKKSGGKILFVLVLLVIIALAILYFLGDGFGFGKGDGDAVPADVTVSEAEPTAVRETIFAEVTVDGESYLYNNRSCTLDELMAEISKAEGEIEVDITLSDTATLAAREALETRLDEENIQHTIVDNADQTE